MLKEEQKIQIEIISKARSLTREFKELALLHHIPNGGMRDPKVAVQMKRMGVLNGIPDLFLPLSCGKWHGLYIEVKTKTGGLSTEQKAIKEMLKKRRFYVITCSSAEQGIRRVLCYIRNSRTFSLCSNNRKLRKNYNEQT